MKALHEKRVSTFIFCTALASSIIGIASAFTSNRAVVIVTTSLLMSFLGVLYYYNSVLVNKIAGSRIAKGKHGNMLGVYKSIIPSDQFDVLSEYTSNAVLRTKVFRSSFRAFSGLELVEFERSFELTGRDVLTKETYKVKNTSAEALETFTILQFGGSIPDALAQKINVKERLGTWIKANATITQRSERGYALTIHFKKPVTQAEIRDVLYEELWEGAMLPDWDYVVFPQACFYGKIENIVGRIKFDRPVLQQHLIRYDLSKDATLDISHVISKKRKKDGCPVYGFEIAGGPNTEIVCWLFQRAPETQPTSA